MGKDVLKLMDLINQRRKGVLLISLYLQTMLQIKIIKWLNENFHIESKVNEIDYNTRYVGYSDLFDVMEEGDNIPTYQMYVDDDFQIKLKKI